MAIDEKQLDHMAGNGVVVKYWYADPDNKGVANVHTSLPDDVQSEAWQDAAFTNGGPLVKLEMIWDPKEAKSLTDASDK